MGVIMKQPRGTKLRNFIYILIVFAIGFIPKVGFYSVDVTTVYAESCSYDKEYFSINDIMFYDPCAPEATCMDNPGAVVDIKSSQENAEAIFKALISTSYKTLDNKPLNAIQAAGFLGNMYVESRFDPAIIQSGKAFDADKAMDPKVGGYAFGIVQWDGSRRVDLMNFAAKNNKPWSDLGIQLAFLKEELEGKEKAVMLDSQFRGATTVEVSTQRFSQLFERHAANGSITTRVQAAYDVYNKYKDLAPGVIMMSDSGVTCSNGGTPPGAGNGNIAATAISLSWSQRAKEGATDHTSLQPKPEYAAALKTTGVNKLGDSCSMAGNSCDAFIATVIRLSGVDPNFPCCGANNQNTYLSGNPDKYSVVTTSVKSASDLAAGDILWRPGHVKIYIGDSREAAASHCERTGEQSKLYLDGTYIAYRPK